MNWKRRMKEEKVNFRTIMISIVVITMLVFKVIMAIKLMLTTHLLIYAML